MSQIHSKAKGFTLIELLVVIVIIGILAGITFTGANFLLGTKDIKKAESELDALRLALKQYESEFGNLPDTEVISDLDDESARGQLLLFSLLGLIDEVDNILTKEERRKSFLPNDIYTFATQTESGDYKTVFMDLNNGDVTFVDAANKQVSKSVCMIDPWNNPYIYEYPRRDGHRSYLLYSKGPDGMSSIFKTELTSTPKIEDIDLDNIPNSEPGKW